MKTYLSFKQQRFLDFIQDHTVNYNEAPSYEEIMKGMGFGSLGTVHWYVNALTHNGHLNRSKGPNGKRALALSSKDNAKLARLPLLGLIAAGEPIEALENAQTISVPAPFVHPDNFVLKVKGDSMIGDHIDDGDYIVVRKSMEAQPGQIVVALINDEATLKRYQPMNDRIELHPRNPAYPIIKVSSKDRFQINGVLLYSFREY